jgi:hypothetical protein
MPLTLLLLSPVLLQQLDSCIELFLQSYLQVYFFLDGETLYNLWEVISAASDSVSIILLPHELHHLAGREMIICSDMREVKDKSSSLDISIHL